MEHGELFYFLNSIWQQARQELRSCDWLVIAGYSFPPTDVQFRMFVADCLAFNDNLQGVTVLSNRKIGNEKAAFEDRYAQLFGGASSRKFKSGSDTRASKSGSGRNVVAGSGPIGF